jgi:Na+/H+ antiporter NhaA
MQERRNCMKLNNKIYDVLKWIAIVFLPALTTFAGVVMNTLNFEYTEIVLTIAVAFDTFLGTILGISTLSYNREISDAEKGLK